MTLAEFLETFVEGNYRDYLEDPGCIRRGFNATVAASHYVDHYFQYARRNDPASISNLGDSVGPLVERISRATRGCFGDIRSISNVYKHLYIPSDPARAVHFSVSSAGAVEVIAFNEGDDIRLLESDVELNPDGTVRERVVYTRKDGSQAELLPALQSVIEYFRRELSQA